jgi:hypothetical protein
MAEIVYALCALTAVACAALLLRGYLRSGARLLLWSSLCFFGLSLNNIILFVDKVLLGPGTDLSVWRSVVAFLALLVLIYGLIWETE